jgi:gentisate 1,2-dioxygenase
VNTSNRPAILFSHTDVPVMRSLDLYREEAHPAGRQEYSNISPSC